MNMLFKSSILTAILLSGISNVSCQDNRRSDLISFDDFPDGGTLTGMRVFEDEVSIVVVEQAGEQYVLSLLGGETIFKVYDRNHRKVGEFGRQGRGPGEFSSLALLNSFFLQENQYHALHIDNNLLRYNLINVSASVLNGETIVSESHNLPNKLLGAWSGFDKTYYSENKLIGFYYDQTLRLLDGKTGWFRYDETTEKIDVFPIHNLSIRPYDAQAEANLNVRVAAYSSMRDWLASALVYVPRLEVLNIKTGETKVWLFDFGEQETVFTLEDFQGDRLIQYFHGLRASTLYLYLLYAGVPTKDYDSGSQGKSLLVMDWDGNPICRYTLSEEYDVLTFSVNEDDKVMYGVSVTNDFVHRFEMNPASCGN